ncbi:hypothetical protein MRBLMA1_002758 [Sphingobium sp. LMA1-1-1.1]|uniref:hypothetical protein n=1 Tax=unclassified Sphingobium TaxID=2611147 RepID=UPI0034317585
MTPFGKLMLGAVLAAAATPALATGEAGTRLVHCRSGSCLLVSGRREDAEAPVMINGHAVSVDGARKWRVRLPVDTVRQWSLPHARTITVAVGGGESEVRLPTGLLGRSERLTMLVVHAK